MWLGSVRAVLTQYIKWSNRLLLQLSLCVAESYLSLISAVLPLISQRNFVETKSVFFFRKDTIVIRGYCRGERVWAWATRSWIWRRNQTWLRVGGSWFAFFGSSSTLCFLRLWLLKWTWKEQVTLRTIFVPTVLPRKQTTSRFRSKLPVRRALWFTAADLGEIWLR